MLIKVAHKLLENRYVYHSYQYCVGSINLHRNFFRQIVNEKFSNNAKSSAIVDLGCGTGLTVQVLPTNLNYIGIDFSAEYLKQTKNSIHKFKPELSFDLIHSDVTSVDYQSVLDKYNRVVFIAFGLLHHLDDLQVEKLANAISKVKDKEVFLHTQDPTIESDSSFAARFVANNDRGKFVRNGSNLIKILGNGGLNLKQGTSLKNQINIPLDWFKSEWTIK